MLMRSSVLARAGACAALAASLAGCAAAASTVTVSGRTLTIYQSAPTGGAGGQAAQDVLDAERLALQQAGSQVGRYSVRLMPLSGGTLSGHARTAIQDTTAIAYLGEVDPGDSADSVGITNAQGLLQVSPTDTALALTVASTAVPGSPSHYYESLKTYGQTFARVVPNASLEAKALISEMQARGVKRLYVASDGSDYGNALVLALTNDAAGASVTVQHSSSGADGAFYAGVSPTAAARAFNQIATAAPSTKLFGPSALASAGFISALSPAAAKQTEISSPGFLPSNLPAGAAQSFVTPFRSSFGHAPAPQAIFGYEAMSAVLAVLKEAGASANNRATVVHDFLTLKNRQSVLGTYSIDAAGDTNLGPFVISHVSGGQLHPFKSLPETG
jgi:branched-chain amino acid transport system substrate-binding protein